MATRTFEGYHWIYWLGPLLGTLVAVTFYKLVKGLEYETVNPNQDGDADNDDFKNDEENHPRANPSRYDGANGVPESHPMAPTATGNEAIRNNKAHARGS